MTVAALPALALRFGGMGPYSRDLAAFLSNTRFA